MDPNRVCPIWVAQASALAFGSLVYQAGWAWALGAMFGVTMAVGIRNLVREWPLNPGLELTEMENLKLSMVEAMDPTLSQAQMREVLSSALGWQKQV